MTIDTKKHIIRLVIFGVLTLFCMVMIFAFSAEDGMKSSSTSDGLIDTIIGKIVELLPSLTKDGLKSDIRKYAHVSEYAALGVTSLLFFNEVLYKKKMLFNALISFVFCFIYACSDEIHQLFVPGRAGKFIDVIKYDMPGFIVGIVLVIIIFVIIQLITRRKDN